MVAPGDLHRSSDRSEVDSEGDASSSMASSTADSKSSPSSSPNSRPIFFMNRATLAGSFSSMSPKLPESASDSRRASSDLTVAKRDMSRVSEVPPQRGHRGDSADEGRSTRRL